MKNKIILNKESSYEISKDWINLSITKKISRDQHRYILLMSLKSEVVKVSC